MERKLKLTERERRALSPPEDLTVSEWAERYRVLDKRASKEPGLWSNEKTPYLRYVMDCFSDFEVEEIVLCFGAQLGKTEALFNMIGYAIDVNPGPAFLVFPTEDVAAYVSRNRLQPMIETSSKLRERKTPVAADFQMYEMKFETMTLYLGWANSPSQLASKPIRYLLMDEVDKYPPFSGREADPIALAEKRVSSYYGFHKIVLASTPTTEHGNIWKRLNSCTTIYRYAVPCPHCGVYQFLEFENLRWEGKEPEEILKNTWYECPHCGGVITELHKQTMLQKGKWEPVQGGKNRRKVGFHLSALYSPFVPWGRIAAEFVEAKDDPARLMDFINSRLAEPFKEVVSKRKEEDILKWKTDLPPGVGPENTCAFVAGVDVQENGFYYTIYAFDKTDAYLVRYGFVGTWEELEQVLFASEYKVKGHEKAFQVFSVFIDSGARTAEVYEWCRKQRSPLIFPVKGASTKTGAPWRETEIEKRPGARGKKWAIPLRLVLIDTSYYKDEIARRLELGGLYFHSETANDFTMQMIAEEKRKVKKGNRYVEEWVRVHRANHYLDCTVYALACADRLGTRYMIPLAQRTTSRQERQERKTENVFAGLRVGTGWLGKKKGWLKR